MENPAPAATRETPAIPAPLALPMVPMAKTLLRNLAIFRELFQATARITASQEAFNYEYVFGDEVAGHGVAVPTV